MTAAPGVRRPASPRPRRRRPHVAHRARVVVGSLAAAVMFALVLAMGVSAYRTSVDQVVATTDGTVSSADSGATVFDPDAARASSSTSSGSSSATPSSGRSSSAAPSTSSAPSAG